MLSSEKRVKCIDNNKKNNSVKYKTRKKENKSTKLTDKFVNVLLCTYYYIL